MTIELPGLIFILREIFPHIHTWKFTTDKERYKIYIFIMEYLFDILQITEEQLKAIPEKKILRDICIYSLLNLDNGMTLLRYLICR